jgi:hypothetical protein
MNPQDAARWHATRTLADVGELTALWLEGKIRSQPGYVPGCGPDEETAELTAVLAACNRAGYLTTSSQPGEDPGAGYNGNTWVQRAAVEGYATAGVLDALRLSAADSPLIVIAAPAASLEGCWETRIPVTLDGATQNTWFGGVPPRSHLEATYSDCHPDVIAAIGDTWQVTMIDPEWGRNTILWAVLSDFTQHMACKRP